MYPVVLLNTKTVQLFISLGLTAKTEELLGFGMRECVREKKDVTH